jgi:hypothetical protein
MLESLASLSLTCDNIILPNSGSATTQIECDYAVFSAQNK